jgi:hypothetical protein
MVHLKIGSIPPWSGRFLCEKSGPKFLFARTNRFGSQGSHAKQSMNNFAVTISLAQTDAMLRHNASSRICM